MTFKGNTANLLDPENRKKATATRKMNVRERKAIAEYIAHGNKTAAYKAAGYGYKKHAKQQAVDFFKRPKIQNALEKALKGSKFDEQYAIETLKKIVDGGMENIEIARPDTSLKALETYFKITNRMGGGTKLPMKADIETQAKRMGLTELQASLKELDKKQKRILAIIGGRPIEGEIIK